MSGRRSRQRRAGPRLAALTIVLLTVFAGLVVVSAPAQPVAAQEGAKFSLAPVSADPNGGNARSYFVLDGEPGAVLEGAVRISNIGGATGTARLYPVDAATGQTSGVVLLMRNDARRKIGSWMALGVADVTLQPAESRDVPFKLMIPKDARPGEHIGGIVAEDAELRQAGPGSPKTNTAGFQIAVQNRVGVAVELTLPGTIREQMAVSGITPGGQRGYQTLILGLQNTGNVRLKPTGTLQVFDRQDRMIQDLGIKLDTFLPETGIDYPVFIQPPALGVGEYRAILVLRFGNGKEVRYETTFAVTPIQVAQVFGAQRALEAPAAAPAPAPATLESLPLWILIAFGLGSALLGMVTIWLVGVVRRRMSRKKPPSEPPL